MTKNQSNQPAVAVGQIWRDNYDYGTGYVRKVKVIAIEGDSATIKAISENGKEMPARKAKLTRFNGSRSGYSFESASS